MASGNPFDPFASSAPAPAAAAAPTSAYGNMNVPTTPGTPQRQYMNSQFSQQMGQPPQQAQMAQQQSYPYGGGGAPGYGQQPQAQQQLVLSAQQPSNPYAGMVTPQQQQHQALVPAMTQAQQPWAVQTSAPSTSAANSGNPFDPFAPPAPPVAAPEAAPPQQLQQFPTPVGYQQQQPLAPAAYNASDPFGMVGTPGAPGTAVAAAVVPAPPPPPPAVVEPEPQEIVPSYAQQNQQQAYNNYNMNGAVSAYSGQHEQEQEQQQQERQLSPFEERNYNDRQLVVSTDQPSNQQVVVRSPDEVRNKYSTALAAQVSGTGASPLPKAELVRKKGYVLSRISFRTIVMKKWKQSFWIQYGSHTMLWFRSETDFNDWLNNPYHNQAQRNFLIKLAVNFVHDLYKPNVRGYQVTQCRTKGYGNKTVRQFKLERWMDYGPTIAAAFGSYDPKEVDACRAAIVECMKNTPLDNGIRATGAVKEHHEQMRQIEQETHQLEAQIRQSQQGRQDQIMEEGTSGQVTTNDITGSVYHNGFPATATADGAGRRPMPTSSQSLVSATDLLGDHAAFDDSASVPPGALIPAAAPSAYPGAPAAPAPAPYYQQPPQQQQQYPSPAGYPPQQPAYGQPPGSAPAVPAYGQAPQPGYYQQQQQQQMGYGYGQQPSQQQPSGYPTAAYPQPSNF